MEALDSQREHGAGQHGIDMDNHGAGDFTKQSSRPTGGREGVLEKVSSRTPAEQRQPRLMPAIEGEGSSNCGFSAELAISPHYDSYRLRPKTKYLK
jgi:hypothetical protein